MADILIDNQTTPSTPSGSKSVLYVDSTTKKFVTLDDSGKAQGVLSAVNSGSGVASQAITTSDTYLTSSGIQIPACGMQVGMLFEWHIMVTKNNTGTSTPIFIVQTGSAQSTADTDRLTLTGGAATAATGGGVLVVSVLVRTVSASGVIVGNFTVPQLSFGSGQVTTAVSSTFDNSALQGQYVSLSVNPGATTWTVDGVKGMLIG